MGFIQPQPNETNTPLALVHFLKLGNKSNVFGFSFPKACMSPAVRQSVSIDILQILGAKGDTAPIIVK